MDREQTQKLIDRVRKEDRAIAQEAISKGVIEAQEKWIEAALIEEALTMEIANIARATQSGADVAARLRALAILIETQVDLHQSIYLQKFSAFVLKA